MGNCIDPGSEGLEESPAPASEGTWGRGEVAGTGGVGGAGVALWTVPVRAAETVRPRTVRISQAVRYHPSRHPINLPELARVRKARTAPDALGPQRWEPLVRPERGTISNPLPDLWS